MRPSTTALPPPLTCTARREVQDVISSCCLLQGRPSVAVCLRPVPGGESAGCVCLQCLFRRLCACCHSLPAMPTALINVLAPVQFALPHSVSFHFACPRSFHVRQDRCQGQQFASCENCPVGSCNTGLQWRPVRRVHLTAFSLCRVHDPGPWV